MKINQADNEEPVAAELIAQSIVKIADGFDRMNKSGLSLKAILLLISHSSGVPQREVKKVLEAMAGLRRDYLAKPKVTK